MHIKKASQSSGGANPAGSEPGVTDGPIHSEALGLARLLSSAAPKPIILAAHSEAQALRLVAAANAMVPARQAVLLPGWDCLPFDRTSPSRAVMGLRMEALRRIAAGDTSLVVAPVEALAQKLPPPTTIWTLEVEPGQPIGRDALLGHLQRLGYALEDEATQPGEVAAQGSVIDVVPADGGPATRIRLEGEGEASVVAGLNVFDPMTQRSRGEVRRLSAGPASELVAARDATDTPDHPPGAEHRLPELAGPLASVFDLLPGAALVLDEDAADRMADYLGQLDEARTTRVALSRATGAPLPPDGLYLDAAGWQAARERHRVSELPWPEAGALPAFRDARDAAASAEAFIEAQTAAGKRVGLSGRRLAQALEVTTVPADGWAALLALPPGSIGLLPAGVARGFAADEAVVIGAGDVLPPPRSRTGHAGLFDVALGPGDAVIHLDYGMARLDGIETVAAGQAADCLLLGFAGDARKLVPCAEMDRVWRYGAGTDGVRLDRADGSSWRRRQGEVLKSLDETARILVQQAGEREAIGSIPIRPPRRAMDRFVAGFPFTPTPDQEAAFSAIATDLAGPRPMDRLLCGDVGFGKTEAALRAVAAVALSGRQAAVLAPTTVLVRQHLATFRRRFEAAGIEVAALSRLTKPAEARAIRARLADGSLRVVIGTQALAAPDLEFADLALVVTDEEQRFGTKAKTALAGMRQGGADRGVHALTLTATPIPRTLQGALAGLQSLSVLSTPPARRQPVRTTVLPLDEAVLHAALTREHARGGQSFCVCPRIEDLDGVAALLGRLVPGLSVVVLHGKMKPDALDSVLVGFSEGHGDVLLSTDIIEAGLDIPRANTIMVWRADLFGLAQLHQLRGRVGRGRARGMAWLFTDPGALPTDAAADRLAALASHDGLGAGFAVAARDLDIRGAGDLLGSSQAGHIKLLGVELARHLLVRAMESARAQADGGGEAPEDEWRPEMVLDLPSTIPAGYMPDPAARIALHARLARPGDTGALTEELEDRYGDMPAELDQLIAQAELRALCRGLGVARLEAGPAAIAADMRAEPPDVEGLERKNKRLLLREPTAGPAERLAASRRLLRLISRGLR